jgi:two-component system, cell cycle sensor histidine kinase and response regulator CckA
VDDEAFIVDMAKEMLESLSKELMRSHPDIPIILCTGFSETVSAEKAMSMGIRKYLMKPFVKRDLAETIRRVLDDRIG